MPDYKKMYLMRVMRETEKAINILADVQKKCEEPEITPIHVEKWGKD